MREAVAKRNNHHSNGRMREESATSSPPTTGNNDLNLNRDEYTKLLIQALQDQGYKASAECLIQESKVSLESPLVASFREAILKGRYEEAINAFPSLMQTDDSQLGKQCRFLIEKQHYLELLQARKFKEAVECLQQGITPNTDDHKQIQYLAGLLTRNHTSLYEKTGWRGGLGTRKQLLKDLQELLPHALMIPERRLEELLWQAAVFQSTQCALHAPPPELPFDGLLKDHRCPEDVFALIPHKKLLLHDDEVWHVSFSHCGRYLAASSKDGTVTVWDAKEGLLIKRLVGHNGPVSMTAWSPDDRLLLSCSGDCRARVWDMMAEGECMRIFLLNGEVTCGGWLTDGKDGDNLQVILASDDGCISKFSLLDHGNTSIKRNLHCRDLTILPNQAAATTYLMMALDTDNTMHFLSPDDLSTMQLFGGHHSATSICISSDGQHLLLNTHLSGAHNEGIILWELPPLGGEILQVRSYIGHLNSRYLLRSCFAFHGEAGVAVGSEDGLIHLYNKRNGRRMARLNGHTASVNCVAWSNHEGGMLASCSDDHSIIIWTSREFC